MRTNEKLRWSKGPDRSQYVATGRWGVYTIDGNGAPPNRWTVVYPNGDYGMVDTLGEAKAWADQWDKQRKG